MRPEAIILFAVLVLTACSLRISEAVTCSADPTITSCIDCTKNPSSSECVSELADATLGNTNAPWGNSPFPWHKVKRALLMF